MDPSLDFRDLGPIGLSILQDVNQRFLNKLYSINSVSQIGCNINIDTVLFGSNGSCLLDIKNCCVDNNETAFTLLLESFYDVLLIIPEKRREIILSQLGMTMNDINNERQVGFIANCTAFASVHNTIDIGYFSAPNCSSTNLSEPNVFTFINSGSVKANCGISEISKGLVFRDDNTTLQKDKNITEIFGMSLITFNLLIISLIIIGLLFIVLNFILIKKPKTKLFVSRNDLKSFDQSFYIRKPVDTFALL